MAVCYENDHFCIGKILKMTRLAEENFKRMQEIFAHPNVAALQKYA